MRSFDFDILDWDVRVLLGADDIRDELMQFRVGADVIEQLSDNISKINGGLTITDYKNRKALLVVGRTTSREEFYNTLFHEQTHLLMHLANYYRIPCMGERICYLSGAIGERLMEHIKN